MWLACQTPVYNAPPPVTPMMYTQVRSTMTPHVVHCQTLPQFTLPERQPPLIQVSPNLAQDDNQYEPIVDNSIEDTRIGKP